MVAKKLGLLCLLLTMSAQAQVFKIATISPEGSNWMKAMRVAAKDITVATEARVKIKFYPGGVMGDDKAVMRKIRFGQLQGAAIASSALTARYTDVQLYGMPMIFKDYAEVDYVRKRMDPVIAAGLKRNGYAVMGFLEVGFAHAMGEKPINSVAAARASKVWIPDDDPGAATAIQAFGIVPIPLTVADVLPSLQTGLIDAVAVPPVGAVTLQWHTQLKYMSELPLLYIYGVFIIDDKQFSKLSLDDQALVRKTIAKALDKVNQKTRVDQHSALNALRSHGMQVQMPDSEEVDEWRRLAQKARQAMVTKARVTATGYEAMNGYLSEFRSADHAQQSFRY